MFRRPSRKQVLLSHMSYHFLQLWEADPKNASAWCHCCCNPFWYFGFLDLHHYSGLVFIRCICKDRIDMDFFRVHYLHSISRFLWKARKTLLVVGRKKLVHCNSTKTVLHRSPACVCAACTISYCGCDTSWKYGRQLDLHQQQCGNWQNFSAATENLIFILDAILSGSIWYPSAFKVFPHHFTRAWLNVHVFPIISNCARGK